MTSLHSLFSFPFFILSLSFFLLFVVNVDGHTHLYSINGRQDVLRSGAQGLPFQNSHRKDVRQREIRCNGGEGKPSPAALNVAAGSQVTLQWYHEGPNDSPDGIIADSHKGPISIYLAEASTNGEGQSWFKIFEKDYSNGRWATEDLRNNRGRLAVTIPSNIKNGRYILRSELIAHHESYTNFLDNPNLGAQLYVWCGEIIVSGGGNCNPTPKVAIPGYADPRDPGLNVNIYYSPGGWDSYRAPGPRVATGCGAAAPAPAPAPAPGGQNKPNPTQKSQGGGGGGGACMTAQITQDKWNGGGLIKMKVKSTGGNIQNPGIRFTSRANIVGSWGVEHRGGSSYKIVTYGGPLSGNPLDIGFQLSGGDLTFDYSFDCAMGATLDENNNGNNNDNNNNNSSGLSGGAIAGIVIGCVAGVALIAIVIVIVVRKRSGPAQPLFYE